MKKNIFILLFLSSFLSTFGQKKYTEIDTLSLQERYNKIRAEGPKVPMDTTQKKSILYRDEIKNILTKYEPKKDKKHKAIEELYYKLQAIILFTYVISNQYDSVVKHYEIIDKNCTNQNTLGSTNNYRSYAELDRNNIVGALYYIEKAIKNFKLSGNKDSENLAFLSLIKIHLTTRNFATAKELLEVFEKENNIKSLSNSVQADVKIFKGDIISELESSEKAIDFFDTIDLEIFKDDEIRFSNYQTLLTKLYLKTERYTEALSIIDKEKNNKIVSNELSNSSNIILFAEAYLGLKDYKKTLYYLKKLEPNLTKNYLANNHIAFNTLYYKYHKAQGNYKEALYHLEIAEAKKDSLNSKEYKLKTSILNYEIKKESELIRLEERAKAQDALLIENKKFYSYLTILISIVIGIIIFLAMLYVKKRKTYQLKLQHKKKQEITNLKNTYIENLSHEIRTPLTIIQGYLELIKNNVFNSANVINYTDKTLKSTDTIIKSLNDFLTILKLEKNEFTSKNSTKNVGEFLNKKITSFESITTLKNIRLYYKTNIKTIKIFVTHDFSSLDKIINNLITNAVKYSNTSSSIFVKSILTAKDLTIIIEDEGIGIDQEDLPYIFSRFYQSKDNTVNDGFGIGLSLVKELVEKLNGTFSVVSEKNIGTSFTLILPIEIENYKLELKEIDKDYTLINKIIESEFISEDVKKENKPKILIVDDDALILVYLKELLKTDFNCTSVFNGLEAIKLASETKFDLIISDLRMPVMQGFELKKKLNALQNYKDVPFLMMSASIYEEKSDSIIKLGVDDFIIKPFKANELLTRVYNLLENKIFRNKLQKNDATEKVEFFGHSAELMDKVNLIIQNNIDNQDFSVDVLAKKCNYSKRQLGRIIQSKTGLTPVKIILEVRLTKAYELLQKKEYQTVKEVVYAIGLNSVSYFNRVFLKRFGIKAKDLLN